MLQGQARGKVGDLVFYVRQGMQQTRVRNRQPENPRTISQMFQRVKLAAVVGFYKRQAAFFRFALKKSQKESYYNAFVRYNLNISPYLTKEQAANGISVPAPYIIADGNMPRIDVAAANIDNLNTLELTTSIPSSIITWGDMRRAYDLVMGDMLTLVVFNAPDDEMDPTKRIVVQHRFDAESENMPIGYDMVGTEWMTDGERVQINVIASYFGLNEFFATGSAIILSRNNGAVDCSYAQLELDTQAWVSYQEYRTEAQRDMAALSYGQEANAILDPKQFEGNYVDMTTFYSTSDYTTPITQLTFSEVEALAVYVKPEDVVGVTSVVGRCVAGANILSEATFNSSTKAVTITPGADPGSGKFVFDLKNSAGTTVTSAVLDLTLEDY